MPRPTSGTTIQRPDLGQLAYEAIMAPDRQGFIADQVLPYFETPEQSGDYPKILVETFLKSHDTRRAPRAGYPRDDWEFTTGQFSCQDHGHEEPLDDVERRMYARLFDAETVAVERAMDKVRRAREIRVAAMIMNLTNVPLTGAAAAAWDVAANCTPKVDVDAAVAALRTNRGIMPNSVVMAWDVFKNVLRSNELKTYLQYTSPHLIETEQAQRDMLAKYFGVDQVLVAGGIYDSADKGQTASLGNIWTHDYVLVARLATNVRDLKEPCLGRTFLWTGDSPQEMITEQYREESIRSWVYRVRNNVDEALVYAGAGYLISGVTT
jgi:hypothetical protein